MKKKIRVWANWMLAGSVVLTFVALMASTQLELDYDFESFFPKDDPELAAYLSFRSKFENDNDFMILGLSCPSTLFDSAFLHRTEALTRSLQVLPAMERVQCITNATIPIIGPMAISQVPLLHVREPDRYYQDSVRLVREPGILGNLVAKDFSAIAIVLKHTDNIGKAEGIHMLAGIDSVLALHGFENARKAGKIIAQETYILKMRDELILFACSSIVLVIVFLWISFRSAWGILVPLCIIVATLIWVLGFMWMTGGKLNLVTTILPTIMFVVGMSDVVHILSKYLDELRKGLGRFEAVKKSIKEVGLATFYTSLTTAVGFASLLTLSIRPIREFGVYTASGVVFAFIITYLVLPAILIATPKKRLLTKSIRISFWNDKLHLLYSRILQHRVKVVVLGSLVSLFLVAGIVFLKVNITLLDDISDRDPLKQDFLFFEQKFAGVRPFEMSMEVTKPGSTLLDYDVLRQMDTVEKYLLEVYGVKTGFSPVTFVKGLNKAVNGGDYNAYALPDSMGYQALRSKLKILSKQSLFKVVATDSMRLGRFTGRLTDQGSLASRTKYADFNRFTASSTDSTLVRFRLTGTALLLDRNNDHLVENMLQGLAIGFLLVMAVVFSIMRSWKVAFIALIVNVLPMAIVAGIMGYTGIPLQVGTSIIFTIAFGIAVDDTLHFIGRLQIERKKGLSMLYAMKRTFLSTGKAVVVTSLILVSGFLTLLFSAFSGTFYTGLLVSLTLIFALLADLFLLPLLLLFFFKEPQQKKQVLLEPTEESVLPYSNA
jgi:hypothetical protein